MAAAAAKAKVANQSRARGKAVSASKPPAAPTTRTPLPEGQQRSRGRSILKAKTTAAGVVVNCNFADCANPARWPVGTIAELAKHPEVKAGTVSCTTHLRTILRARNLLEQQASFETRMLGGVPKPQPRRRRAAPKTRTEVTAA
jgi:hypothetical protein